MQIFSKNLLIFLLVFIKCSHQRISDPSFQNYCIRFGGQFQTQTIEKDKDGNVVKKPVGDKCKVDLNFYAKDKDEAQLYCERWGIFVLIDWGRDNDDRVHCTYENVYECENNFEQIRGLCYQHFYDLNTYEEAEKTCKDSHAGAEILKIQSKHHGVLLETYYPGDLTMYFVQPDKTLELSSQFVASDEADDQNKNYVLLYNYGIHYDVGPNSIIKLDKSKKAFAMCMYQPPETILSFGVKARKLAEFYHPTQLVGAMGVWRSASHYTPKNIPGYPNSHQDVCEASMKAILGTSDGTLLNLKPENTKLLNDDVKKSFNRAFGPFAYCEHTYDYILRHEIYFASKEVVRKSCSNQANILEKDYNADFMRKLRPFEYSFVYYPENTHNGKSIEAIQIALHSPMLCGLHYDRDLHKANPLKAVSCPSGWSTYQRPSELSCHLNVHSPPRTYDEARDYCRSLGGKLATWSSSTEFKKFGNTCSGGWTACIYLNGCSSEQSDSYGRRGIVQWGNLITDYPNAGDIHVFCETNPVPIEEL
ncbi:unnamed protein product [Caenorhabditis angaria]|uniref:C-type lectin domain-containing protein n=1 Tax=Caenorhabditis angaria TaxID=860376 RepID=A0A9P1IBH5_9PELO|nr:unnamed protein product [Caenorhabditis angaria]